MTEKRKGTGVIFLMLAASTLVLTVLRIFFEWDVVYSWIVVICMLSGWGVVLGILLYEKHSLKTTIAAVLAVLCISAVITFPYREAMPKRTFITISATGEKNEASASEVVCITVINLDWEYLDLEQLSNDYWQIGEWGELYSTQGEITLDLAEYFSMGIGFWANNYSGIMEITTPAGTQRYDLYREEGSGAPSFEAGVPFTPRTDGIYSFAINMLFMTAAVCALMVVGIVISKKNKDKEPEMRTIRKSVQYIAIPTITPLYFISYLYAQNEPYLNFTITLTASSIIVLFSILAYLFLTKFFLNCKAAALIVMVWWIYFFTFMPIKNNIWNEGDIHAYFIMSFFILILLSFAIRALALWIKAKEAYFLLSVIISVGFLFNFTPSVYRQLTMGDAESQFNKTTFQVDAELPKPNIYWFHMDGMMSFDSVERVFGDTQDGFRADLEERGFKINSDAYFEARTYTLFAMPVLLSPFFYDSALADVFGDEGNFDATNMQEYGRVFDKASGISGWETSRRRNELLGAFWNAGYNMSWIAGVGSFGHLVGPNYLDYMYRMDAEEDRRLLMSNEGIDTDRISEIGHGMRNLNELLGRTSMTELVRIKITDIINAWESEYHQIEVIETKEAARELIGAGPDMYAVQISMLLDSMQREMPYLVFLENYLAHCPFLLNEKGEAVNGNGTYGGALINYLPQHKYAVDVLMKMIDLIVNNEPDAVIVIQADHGPHFHVFAGEMMEWGLTMQQMRDFGNGVISAVRIPDKYGGLDEPLDPLNISRELVNRFVGQNYELLPSDHPNQRRPELTEADWARWSID